ncbi:MAG: hypothetical protein WEB37_09080 [Bacteroidota bacterium]
MVIPRRSKEIHSKELDGMVQKSWGKIKVEFGLRIAKLGILNGLMKLDNGTRIGTEKDRKRTD